MQVKVIFLISSVTHLSVSKVFLSEFVCDLIKNLLKVVFLYDSILVLEKQTFGNLVRLNLSASKFVYLKSCMTQFKC